MHSACTMRIACYERFGPPHDVLRLGEAPVPQPDAGEVLVAVALSGINPHDTKKRSGWLGRPMQAPRVVPHADGAGVVAAIGEGGDPARVGERVWFFRADAARRGQGSAAAYVVLPAAHAVRLPDAVPFEAGASLGVPALTAYAAVFGDGPIAGLTVLVQGGTGAVGGYAVQLARHGGARVLATVGTPEKAALARALGAEMVIDYRREDVAAAVLAASEGGVDRVVEVDFGANVATDAAVLREHGVIASYSSTSEREPRLPYYPLAFKGVTVHALQGTIMRETQRAEAVRHIGALLAEGALRHPPTHRFPLARIANAHQAVESGIPGGKILVELGDGI